MKELLKKNKRLVLLVAAIIMMFGLFLPTKQVMAAGVISVSQVGADKTSVDIQFTNSYTGLDYEVTYSKQQNAGYIHGANVYSSAKSICDAHIYSLESGEVYYVKVIAKKGNSIVDESQPYPVITTPDASTCSMTQTNATKDSITLAWTPAKGASGYYIYVGGSDQPLTVASESYTIGSLAANTKYGIAIYPFKTHPETQKIAAGNYNYVSGDAITTCSAPTQLDVYSYDGASATVQFRGASSAADGYEIEVSKLNGKFIKKYYVTSAYTTKMTFKNNNIKNKGFMFRVRSYYNMGGNKAYGDWSSKKVIIPMPKMKVNSSVLKWTKVSGAKNYTIYKSSTQNGKYKKYKTVSGKTTSYDLGRGFNGYVYVVANKVKSGKKYYNSTKPTGGHIVYHIYTRYYWR